MVSFLPPDIRLYTWNGDPDERMAAQIQQDKYSEFIQTMLLDITRNQGFIHHPSRETNSYVEGALLQEDQNMLVENMRYLIAEECVKRGVWKSVSEALEERENLRRKHNPRISVN